MPISPLKWTVLSISESFVFLVLNSLLFIDKDAETLKRTALGAGMMAQCVRVPEFGSLQPYLHSPVVLVSGRSDFIFWPPWIPAHM